MAFDPLELMGPRERLAYNINMRPRAAADGAAVPPPSHHATPSGDNYFGEDGLQFSDLVDILNPLQHLPLISMAYRSITGDEISAGARVVGGAIYGGGVGVFVGAIEAAIAEASGGKDLGAIALDAVTGSYKTETASSASEHKEASITALNDIMPAAGGGETAPTAPSWIYSDAPLAPLAPEPAPTQALASPAIQQSAAPLPPTGPMPIPSTPGSQLDSMPELSQDQISLLLQSVGLDPKTGASMPNSATAPASSPAIAPQITTAHSNTPPAGETVRFGLGPMKQNDVRPPPAIDRAYPTPVAQTTQAPETPAVMTATTENDGDLSAAMASALDKYRRGKVMERSGEVKGSRFNGAY